MLTRYANPTRLAQRELHKYSSSALRRPFNFQQIPTGKSLILLKLHQYAVPNRRKDYGDSEGVGCSTSGDLRITPGVPTRSVSHMSAGDC